MAKKIFKRLYYQWIVYRMEKLEQVSDSKKAYIPIDRHMHQEKINRQLEMMKRHHEQMLSKEKYYTMDKEQRIDLLVEQKKAKVDRASYWKKRRLKHQLALIEKSNQNENQKTFDDIESQLLALEDKNHQKLEDYKRSLNDRKLKLTRQISLEEYQSKVAYLDSKYSKVLENLNQKLENRTKNLKFKTDRFIQKKESQVALLSQVIQSNRQKEIELDSIRLDELKAQTSHEQNTQEIDYLNARTMMSQKDSEIHLSVNHLTMTFSGLRAVDDLSFNVKKGSIFGLIGPNGAGKTTVFNCITQFYKPKGGQILFRNNKNDVIRLTDYPVHHIIKQGIVRTFQNVELIWELNILDNMLVGAHTLYKSGFFTQLLHLPQLKREEEVIRNKAIQILTTLGLIQYKDFYPLGLPYGILKKIELARTLMTDPKLIILDEPAAGLNDIETKALAQTIREINKNYGCTIFLVEHDMELVMDICDEICAISFGKKLAIGTPKEIQNHPLVREAYLGGE